jgi:hypothetical protein
LALQKLSRRSFRQLHGCAAPGSNIFYFTSPLCPSGQYHLLFGPSGDFIFYLASQPCPSGILIPISPQRRASPGDIIIYSASPLRLFGDIKWANPQTPLPHWVLGKLFGRPFCLDHCCPSSGTSRRMNMYCSDPNPVPYPPFSGVGAALENFEINKFH